jgi:hypothetical protein
MPTRDDVLTAAADLPGVEVGTSCGTPSLKVRGKFMCRRGERLVRQLGADEIKTAPREHLEASACAPSSETSRVLPTPASPATSTLVPWPGTRRVERALRRAELAGASDEHGCPVSIG